MQSDVSKDGGPVGFKRMIKPLAIMILIVAIVLGGILGWQAFIGSMRCRARFSTRRTRAGCSCSSSRLNVDQLLNYTC